jgi:probable phosphoglycerate mutase
MRSLYLVRHPATPWSGLRYAGRTDVPLSQAGLRQASVIAAGLTRRIRRPTRVVSSPLHRAGLAALCIAEAGGWSIEGDARWREVDFGAAEGLTFGEVAEAWPMLAAQLLRGERRIDWPEGEDWRALHARVDAALRKLIDDPPDSVVVVTHGGPIAAAIESLGCEASTGTIAPGEVLEIAIGQQSRVVRRWKSRP